MKYFKKAVSIILNMLIFCIVALVIFIMISSVSHRVPSVFGHSVLRIVSNSMSPKYIAGDYILVRKVKPENLSEGDVISFYSNDPSIKGMPNTHQIEQIENKNSFITKGLANEQIDMYKVSSNEIIGKVVGKLGFFKYISPIINNKILFMLIIIVPLCIIIFFEVKSIFKKKEPEDEDNQSS